ncbi:iron-containing alcohol dehydrogenase [Zavarzinella formosa]|uniref:iron-containing alcohol dehydrogenase n=1 Tax=Zavarzinella formosa TaxID=360055 RepID=UPI00037C3472|nr:iron-containing alcohol dehydrogenase [Zavarzinella formosa]
MRTTFTFRSSGNLLFGRNAVRELGTILDRLNAKRVFILTDKILGKIGITAQVVEAAGRETCVFDGGEPEPSLAMVRSGIAAARAFKPDCIIGLGGGSNMDAAKLAAVVLGHGGDPLDYVGENKVPGPIMPLVCIPTTAGTGSEVSQAAVFTNTEIQLKVSCLSYYLRPAAAIVDPMLTISCPPKVTADSGIDALTHAIEAYSAVDNATYPLPPGEVSVYQGKNFFADMCAEKAIVLTGQFLRRAVKDANDLEARDGMALAGTLGGLAFSNAGVALVHAMEYPVGAAVHCSHGEGNGLLLPFVMRYNLPQRAAAFAEIARFLGTDTTGQGEAQAAETAIKAVEQLKKDIGIPTRLRDIRVTEDQLQPFAEKAFSAKRLMRVNPRYPTVAEIEEVFRAAW